MKNKIFAVIVAFLFGIVSVNADEINNNLYEDITYRDSQVQEFLVLVDGSYVLIDDKEYVYGESYVISDGHIRLLCQENERKELR